MGATERREGQGIAAATEVEVVRTRLGWDLLIWWSVAFGELLSRGSNKAA